MKYGSLLYRQECFTGKYTTRKIHTKLHPGPEWRIFHILASEDIDDVISRSFTVLTTIFYSLAALVRTILFLPLENKINIFAPPCNILYLLKTGSLHNAIPGI